MPQTPHVYIAGLNAVIDGQNELALKLLSTAVSENSDLPDAYLQLAKLFLKKGESYRGQKILRDLLLRTNLHADFLKNVEYELISSYLKFKKFQQAEEAAKHSLELLPDDATIRGYLVTALEGQGKYREAEDHWKAFCESHNQPHKPRIALYRVEEGRATKDLKERKKLLMEALRLDPHCASAYYLLAVLYRESESFKNIVEIWSQFIKNAPEKAYWIFMQMEDYYFDNNQFDKLRETYVQLGEQDGPHQFYALLALSKYFQKVGDKTQVSQNIRHACEIYRGSDTVLKNLTATYLVVHKRAQDMDSANDLFLSFITDKYYVCQTCRRSQKNPEWHCTQCGSWDSYTLQ